LFAATGAAIMLQEKGRETYEVDSVEFSPLLPARRS
jgi:hypothetical protein